MASRIDNAWMRKAIIMCAQLYTSCWWIFHRDIDSDVSYSAKLRRSLQVIFSTAIPFPITCTCARGRWMPYVYVVWDWHYSENVIPSWTGREHLRDIYTQVLSFLYNVARIVWYRRTNLKIDNILLSETPPHNRAISTWKQTFDQLYRVAVIDVVFTAAGTLLKYIHTEYNRCS
jgi:hypothetical protein